MCPAKRLTEAAYKSTFFIVLWVCSKHKYNSVIVNVFFGAADSNMYRFQKKNEEKRWRFVCAAAASGSPPICSGRSSGAYPSLKDPEEKQTVCECEPLRRRRRGLGSTPRSLKTPATTWNPPHSPSRATRTDPAPPRAAGRPEFDITYIFLTEECYLNRRVTEILLYIIHV